MRPKGRWKLTSATAAAVITMMFGQTTAGAMPADPGEPPPDVTILGSAGDWTRFSGPYGLVYGTPITTGDDSLFVIAGDRIENVCGVAEPLIPADQTGRLRQRPSDGKWVLRDTVDTQIIQAAVYERPEGIDDVFMWFGAVCPAIAGGAPIPQPIAAGPTELFFDAVTDAPWWFTFAAPQPSGRYYNGVRGVVRGIDGAPMYLNAQIRFTIPEAGPPMFHREFIKLTPVG